MRTMKLGLAVAPGDAPPDAFVVYRDDLQRSIERSASLGYDGVELALRDAAQLKTAVLKRCLARSGVEIACISSGQVFAVDRLYFTHPEEAVRGAAVERICGLIRLAAEFGAKVNLGRARGFIHHGETRETAKARFLACLDSCAKLAARLGVELIIEPVNRYESNFINNCQEGLEIVRDSGHACVKLMADLFHMNIEDASFREAFLTAKDYITYIHVADSNRLAPGWGHLNFDEVFRVLVEIGYQGYLTAEILPQPDPDAAAAQAVGYLSSRLDLWGRSRL
jgi:sugar phosphate isomerase/epimerase